MTSRNAHGWTAPLDRRRRSAGVDSSRPRPHPPVRRLGERDREMYRLRTVEGMTHAEIARRYRIGPERVRQVLRAYAHQMTPSVAPGQLRREAADIRRAKKMALAEAHARAIVAAWRANEHPSEIARRLGLPQRCIALVIRMSASPLDRAVRARVRRTAAHHPLAEPSAE